MGCNKRLASLHLPVALLLAALLCATPALCAPQRVAIGVLAKRGPEIALRKWQATARYLSAEIPDYTFSIVPLDFDALFQAVGNGEVDFFITNSSLYVELESRFKVSRIATLENRVDKETSSLFGGVIFTSIARNDLNSLADLKGQSFMAVHPRSLGGWQMAWRELQQAGINPFKDFSALRFGETHDAVVHAVLTEQVAAGTVRTDTLERMLGEGTIALNDFRVINPQPQYPNFPMQLSTPLYPEWPFARLQHTPKELTKLVAHALLHMPPDSKAAIDAKIAGWNVPLDYLAIHDLMRELHLGPYQDIGKASMADIIEHRWRELTVLVFLFVMMLTALFWSLILNRRIQKIQHSLRSELTRRQSAESQISNRPLKRATRY